MALSRSWFQQILLQKVTNKNEVWCNSNISLRWSASLYNNNWSITWRTPFAAKVLFLVNTSAPSINVSLLPLVMTCSDSFPNVVRFDTESGEYTLPGTMWRLSKSRTYVTFWIKSATGVLVAFAKAASVGAKIVKGPSVVLFKRRKNEDDDATWTSPCH